MRFPLTLVLLLALLSVGCGGFMGRAKRDYHDGRYLEAAEQLGDNEDRVSELPPQKQADYGIYRGLSLMMLGDYSNAHRWLGFAVEVERKNPGTLLPEQRASIHRGYIQLSQLSGAAFGAAMLPPPPVVAVPPPPEPVLVTPPAPPAAPPAGNN